MTADRFADAVEEVIAALLVGDITDVQAHARICAAADARAANEAEAVARPWPWPLPKQDKRSARRETA